MKSANEIVTLPFTACLLTTARTLWHNSRQPPDYVTTNALPWNASEMVQRWAYAIPGDNCFPAENFNLDRQVTMQAEAYGGEGSAGNGGGARVGNLYGVQLKGIGPNMFVGANTAAQYGYGAFYLEHAIAEAIYAQLVSRLLPLGAMTVYGVLDSGQEFHFKDPESGFSHCAPVGILLREICTRPGHFLPAQEFKPCRHQRKVMDDTQRMRTVMRRLKSSGRGDSAIEAMLLNFLSQSALQFAWARASRLMHGAVTPSNLSLDGRWLDLSQTSTLPPGINQRRHAARLPFAQESYAPPDFAHEIIHFYNKYTQSYVSSSGMLRHYDLCWQRALPRALLAQSGLQYTQKAVISAGASWCQMLNRMITGSGLPATCSLEELDQDDAFTGMLLQHYAALETTPAALTAEQQALQLLITADWQQAKIAGSPLSLQQHQRTCLLRAWRRSAFAPLFWRGRIEQVISAICKDGVGQVEALINQLTEVMDFAFSQAASVSAITLLSLEETKISWLPREECYRLTYKAHSVDYSDPGQLMASLRALPENWQRWNFDFLQPLLTLLTRLATIEKIAVTLPERVN